MRAGTGFHTQLGSRVQLAETRVSEHHRVVSILTQPGSRVQRGSANQPASGRLVSILTQLGSRMQHVLRPIVPSPDSEFQSSSSPEAGCNTPGCSWPTLSTSGFNPHPARKPGATSQPTGGDLPTLSVSILTQPGSRVQHDLLFLRDLHESVSILTQPGSRVQRPGAVFESAILTQPGSRVQRWHGHEGLAAEWFQSSPSPEAGCNPPSNNLVQLTGPRGFNPHPARKPGATAGNPHPARKPGATWRRWHGFNPHPARKPGATRHITFSILTQPGSRVQLGVG